MLYCFNSDRVTEYTFNLSGAPATWFLACCFLVRFWTPQKKCVDFHLEFPFELPVCKFLTHVVFFVYFTVLLTHDVALASGKYTPLL